MPAQALQRRLLAQGLALGLERLRCRDALRLVHAEVLGTLAGSVLGEAAFEVIGDTGVPGAALALDDVDPPAHRRSTKGKAAHLTVRGPGYIKTFTCGWKR